MDGGRQYLRKPGQIIIIMENKVTKGNFKERPDKRYDREQNKR